MDDLQRKARSVAEGIEFSAKTILTNNDLRSANRLVESFQKRERLQGCVIYDKEGSVFAITRRFLDWKEKQKNKRFVISKYNMDKRSPLKIRPAICSILTLTYIIH